MSQQVSEPRFRAIALLSIAVLAVLLAATGVYGVIAYSVSQRTSEFGIRVALGASRSDIARLVMRDGLRLAAGGCTLGLASAYALTSTLGSMLYGIAVTDFVSYTSAAAFAAFVAAIASIVPARRATRVDPVVALRSA